MIGSSFMHGSYVLYGPSIVKMVQRCIQPDYACLDVPRPTTAEVKVNHEGVAAIISNGLRYEIIVLSLKITTFESVCIIVTSSTTTVAVRLLYCPGSAYLQVLAFYKCQIIIAGDFNIHSEISDNRLAMMLHDILASIICIQQVLLQTTHRHCGTHGLVWQRWNRKYCICLLSHQTSSPTTMSSVGLYHFITNLRLCLSMNSGAKANLTKMNFDQHSSTLSCATLKSGRVLWYVL